MDHALLMRRFEGFGDLLRDGQRFAHGDGALRDPLGEIVTLDEFHHERMVAFGCSKP